MIKIKINTKIRLTILCLSGVELYSRLVPLIDLSGGQRYSTFEQLGSVGECVIFRIFCIVRNESRPFVLSMAGYPVQSQQTLIMRQSLELGAELGQGEFGSVLKGVWTDPKGKKVWYCAVQL